MLARRIRRAASAAACLTTLLTVQAGTDAAAVTRPPARHAVPAQVRITEGQVAEVRRGGVITYPSVTSCLTVTVRLAGGGLVGAHASIFQVPGELRSDEILAALRGRVGDRPVRAVEVRGAVGAWHPGWFTKAVESYGPGEDVPYPTKPDPDGLAEAVARGLGQVRGKVTVEDVPDGDQTVR